MHAVIRADGSDTIGYGHLARTSALAEILLERDHQVSYATTTTESVERMCPQDVGLIPLSDRTSTFELLDWVDENDPDFAFVDAYPVDENYQSLLRDRIPLAVLQDDAQQAVCADVLINGNLYAKELEYDTIGEEPLRCLGSKYLPLRSSISSLAQKPPTWRQPPQKAVITFGGSDVENLTPRTVRAFDETDISITAVVGPGSSNERSVRDAASAVDTEVTVLRNPTNFGEILFDADLAVSACGSTIYELLALGTPTVSIPVVDNQRLIAESLRERELAIVLGEDPKQSDIRSAIHRSIKHPDLRRKHRRGGRKTVDGRGALRICNRTLSLVEQERPSQ